jgi:thioredoxin 1
MERTVSMVADLKETTLMEASLSKDICIIDFWADWCKPCMVISKPFEELSTEMSGFRFYKVDVGKHTDIAEAFGVQGLPTIVVTRGAKKVGSITGTYPKDKLASKIMELVKGA